MLLADKAKVVAKNSRFCHARVATVTDVHRVARTMETAHGVYQHVGVNCCCCCCCFLFELLFLEVIAVYLWGAASVFGTRGTDFWAPQGFIGMADLPGDYFDLSASSWYSWGGRWKTRFDTFSKMDVAVMEALSGTVGRWYCPWQRRFERWLRRPNGLDRRALFFLFFANCLFFFLGRDLQATSRSTTVKTMKNL